MSKNLWTIALFAALGGLFLFFAVCRFTSVSWQTEKRFQMATTTKITLKKRLFRSNTEAFQKAFAAIDDVEKAASRFLPESELNKINQAEGNPHKLSRLLFPMWKEAAYLYKLSEGRFDVTAGALISLWGFGPEGKKAKPTTSEIETALSKTGFDKAVFSNGFVTLPKGMQIDLNSLAAGYAADCAAKVLRDLGEEDFLVDAGGEIVCSGKTRDWNIGVREPKDGEPASITVVALKSGAVSTSGSYANFFRDGTNYYTHIVNAKTGTAFVSPLISVTVLAKDGLTADGFSTMLFCLPVNEALQLAEKEAGLEALFLIKDGTNLTVRKTSGWR